MKQSHISDRRMLGLRRSSTVQPPPDHTNYDNPLLVFDDSKPDSVTGRTELEDYIWKFAEHADLVDRYEILRFGARLARDKHGAMSRYADELTTPEKELLKHEQEKSTGFWKQSKFLRATIATASPAGMIQGWTQSVNNGANGTGMPDKFGICYKTNMNCKSSDLWLFGLINALPLLSAGVFGTILADPLQENFLARRGSIMLSCFITVASTIGASLTDTFGQMAACRVINGIALGAKASIVPIYSAEISPNHIRGAILCNWQLADAAGAMTSCARFIRILTVKGIFFGFLANLLVVIYADREKGWRILTNTVLIPTIPLLVMIYLMPESPRYLMKHGKYRKAFDAFQYIQTSPLLASRDLVYAHAQLDFESRILRRDRDRNGTTSGGADGEQFVMPLSFADLTTNGTRPPVSQASISPRNSIDITAAASPSQHPSNMQSRSEHLQPGDSGRVVNIGTTDIELEQVGRRGSDISSLNIEAQLERYRKKENPYSYHIGVTGYYKRLLQLWQNRRCRRATLAASIAMISQQMTGVNTIAFLGTIIWEGGLNVAGQDSSDTDNARKAAIIGLAFGAANYIFGLPAYYLSDRIGRANMLAIGLPNMAWSMLVFAFLFKIPDNSARVPLVAIFAVIFVSFYAPTAGTSPFSISAEVFPLVSREAGMALAVAVNLLGAGILVLVFPFVHHSIGSTGSLSIFAGLNVVAFFLVYLFVPETRMRTLEELNYTFDLPTRWHVNYRITYIRKHIMKNWANYITLKSVDPPIPFYEWARIKYRED